jgi:hypothetical protein
MIIKKHNNKNQYLLTKYGHWVRDFTKSIYPTDINNLISESEYDTLINNELKNSSLNIAAIDAEYIAAPNVVIVSDGYKFNEKKHLLKKFPRSVTIIGVNRSLANWSPDIRMDYYLVNNPFRECMSNFPNGNYLPKCIISCRTHSDFVRRYKANRGVLYRYSPVGGGSYGGVTEGIYNIDDYRNPICAAIGLAYRWRVGKLLLFCCEETFEGNRPGAVPVQENLYTYPQNNISHELIDGNLYWLKQQEFNPVKVGCFGEGTEYTNAPYISEESLEEFFR